MQVLKIATQVATIWLDIFILKYYLKDLKVCEESDAHDDYLSYAYVYRAVLWLRLASGAIVFGTEQEK